MMYSEFVNGTGCKDNEHNYEVFKNLEIMYMNSDMSKEEVYEYGRKLVDNSKSEKQIEFEEKVNNQIKELKEEIKWYRSKIQMYEDFIKYTSCSLDEEAEYREWIKAYKQYIKSNRNEINNLKWVLE